MKFFSMLILFVTGIFYCGFSKAVANTQNSLLDLSIPTVAETTPQKNIILARRMGGMGCREDSHKHDNNCTEMGHGRGMGHGMRHGMGRGPGLDGEAQCPQIRSTAKAPESFQNKINPLENTSENIEGGRLLFQLNAQPTCTVCHGSGNGLGMMSGGLNPPPRNFMCQETMQNISDGQLFWVIKNGSPGTGMPAFSGLNDEQVWQLIHYIRQFTK